MVNKEYAGYVESSVQQKVEDSIFQYLSLAQKERVWFYLEEIDITYDLDGTSCFGEVIWDNRRDTPILRLHGALLMESPEKYIESIVGHEIAHLIVDWLFFKAKHRLNDEDPNPHGSDFKKWCKIIGLSKEQSLSCTGAFSESAFLITKRLSRKYAYWGCKCSKEKFALKKKQHDEGDFLSCPHCKEMLVFSRLIHKQKEL